MHDLAKLCCPEILIEAKTARLDSTPRPITHEPHLCSGVDLPIFPGSHHDDHGLFFPPDPTHPFLLLGLLIEKYNCDIHLLAQSDELPIVLLHAINIDVQSIKPVLLGSPMPSGLFSRDPSPVTSSIVSVGGVSPILFLPRDNEI
jgi:hypothetical protein